MWEDCYCQLEGKARVSELVLWANRQLQADSGAERRLREQVWLDGGIFPGLLGTVGVPVVEKEGCIGLGVIQSSWLCGIRSGSC